MEESILTSIKLNLGVTEDYTHFDQQILSAINTAMNALTQLGVGPIDGFHITDKTTTWAEYLGDDKRYDCVKEAITIRVRLLFDTPASNNMIEALKEQLKEIEWRLLSTIEHPEV